MSRRRGVVTAFVREVDAKNGRVQLEYRAMEDNLKSAWAPIASPMSGGARGQLFMPESGDECLVAFENGEFNHPFVVGFLWNGEHNSPERKADNRVIVTPGGHQLRFEDKDNDKRVKLKSKGGHELLLEDPTAAPLAQLKSNGDRRITLNDKPASGRVEIVSSAHHITLDDTPGATRIEISAGMGAVTIMLNATPQPSISISAGGNNVDIGGAGMTVTAGGALTVACGGTANISVGGAASINAGGAISLTASAVTVNSPVTTFAGAVVASSISATTYSPGIGNLV